MNEKTKECKVCFDKDIKNFTPKSYDFCRNCKLKSQNKSYYCNICGENNSDKFIIGRYGICKICKNKKKSEIYSEKTHFEKDTSNFKPDKELKLAFDNYISYDGKIFDGLSIKQMIKNLVSENLQLQSELKILKNKDEIRSEEFFKIKMMLNDFMIDKK